MTTFTKWSEKMAMPQRDDLIDQLNRLEGLFAWATEHGDVEEAKRIEEKIQRLAVKI